MDVVSGELCDLIDRYERSIGVSKEDSVIARLSHHVSTGLLSEDKARGLLNSYAHYGKDDFSLYFHDRVPARSVVYIDDKRLKSLERYARIQFPGAYSDLEPNAILKRPRCSVNVTDGVGLGVDRQKDDGGVEL